MQASKGINNGPKNLCTFKLYSIKLPMFSQRIRKQSHKTLGNSVINSPLSPLALLLLSFPCRKCGIANKR